MHAMCGTSLKDGASSQATPPRCLLLCPTLVTAGFGIKTLIWCSTESEFLWLLCGWTVCSSFCSRAIFFFYLCFILTNYLFRPITPLSIKDLLNSLKFE